MSNILDFESYSPVPIEHGAVKYAIHPDADIVMLSLKLGLHNSKIWLPQHGPLPELLLALTADPTVKFYAHNALFDYIIWHFIGVKKYGFPEIPLERWIDSQALANRYTFPGKLKDVGEILGFNIQKDRRGDALIRKICIPTKDGRRPQINIDFTYQDFEDFQDYAKTDCDSTAELVDNLPSSLLSEEEQNLWVLTQKMNLRGIPVDVETADKILMYIDTYTSEMTHRVPEITDGSVQKVTQVKKVVEFLNSRGVPIKNLQAETVEHFIDEFPMEPELLELLELRQTLGRSSTAKYAKLRDCHVDGRIYNMLQYYGAQKTGRWAGRNFQLHNLPRAKVDDPESYIEMFNNFIPVDNPIHVAKALIRPMLCAPAGKKFLVSDYNAIEPRILFWYAGEEDALDAFRYRDIYIDMAAYVYKVPYESIGKGPMRQFGKVIILGCGFNMGAETFQENARKNSITITLAEAKVAVDAYREKFWRVVEMWNNFHRCVVAAIRNPNRIYETNKCKFRTVKDRVGHVWLIITLASGRNLYYYEPYLEATRWGFTPAHWGVHPKTKQWTTMALIKGRITENIIQGTARDVMANGLVEVEENLDVVDLIGQVHDEAISETDDYYATPEVLEAFNAALCKEADWMKGLPLVAEGYISRRYRKG